MSSYRLLCLGLDHRNSPVELRERSRCTLEDLKAVHLQADLRQELAPLRSIYEFALLSTCNRIELYAVVDRGLTNEEAEAALRLFLALASGTDPAELATMPFNCYFGMRVIEHLASVAAGLDSLVLGEAQILGQVAEAYQTAAEAHTLGPTLDALMRAALRTGKRVRHETSIGANPASISSVAIALAQQTVGTLQDKRIVVIGLGKMGQMTLKALTSRSGQQIAVVNRSLSKAEPFAAAGYKVYPLAQLSEALREADIVFSATGSDSFILPAAEVAQIQEARAARPLTLVDIALPRDIEPTAAVLPGVQLLDLDELYAGLDDALAARKQEVPRVQSIVDEEVGNFAITLRELAMRPVVADLRQHAEEIRQEQLARTLRFVGEGVDDAVLAQFDHLSRALVNRLLHAPTTRLREVAVNGEAEQYASAVRDLFNLSNLPSSTS